MNEIKYKKPLSIEEQIDYLEKSNGSLGVVKI